MQSFEEYQREQYEKAVAAEAEAQKEAALLAGWADMPEDTRTEAEIYEADRKKRLEAEAKERELKKEFSDSIAHWGKAGKNDYQKFDDIQNTEYNKEMEKLAAEQQAEEASKAAAIQAEKNRYAVEVAKNSEIPIEDIAIEIGAYKHQCVANFKKSIIENGITPRYAESLLHDIEVAMRFERALKFCQGQQVEINEVVSDD